jgi:NADP-dependent 3-hydroxy acid dehydrogenase YdfG
MSDTKQEQAVILGATGTVGSAIVARLVARGMQVVAVARTRDKLGALAATSSQIKPCVADIADDASIDAIRAKLDRPVKLAVFAAGLPVGGSAVTIEPGAFAVGGNIKLGGLVRLLRAVRDNLQRGSRFVTMAGSVGLEASAHAAGPARLMPACST